MKTNKIKGFTVIEMLVGLAILSFIISAAILMMTRGAKNVKKGSFNTLAANQAFWIYSVLRDDFSKSLTPIEVGATDPNVSTINIDESSGQLNTVHILLQGGSVEYSIETNENGNKFLMRHIKTDNNSLKQKFGDEYLEEILLTKTDSSANASSDPDSDSSVSYPEFDLVVKMLDSTSSSGKNEMVWKAKIYTPVSKDTKDQFWYSTIDNSTP